MPNHTGEAQFSELRQRAEAIVAEQTLDLSDVSPEAMQPLIHELKVHQIELELQNEALRQVQFERELAQKNYADLYDFAPVGYLTLDEDGLIVEANLTGAEMLGRDKKALNGQRLSRFVLPADQDAYHLYCRQLAQSDRLQRCEIRLVKKDGLRFYAGLAGQRARSSGLPGEDNDRQYHLVMSDITQRKAAEEAYQNLVDHSLQGLAIFQDSRFVFANAALARITGSPVDELLTMSAEGMAAILHPDDRARVRAQVQDRLVGKPVPARLEVRFIHQDGRVRWMESYASRIEYRGKPAIQVAILDITERKQAEETRAYLAAIVKSSGDAIIGQTLAGIVVSWNPGAERLYGYRAAEMRGQSITRLIPPELHAEFSGLMSRVRQGETIENHETQHLTRDGQGLTIALTLSPIEDGPKAQLGVSMIVRDITQRKQAQLELAHLVETIRTQQTQLRAVTGRLAEVQESERKALARELHDQVGQKLTALNLNLNLIAARLPQSWPASEALMSVLDQSLKLVEETTEQIQDVMADLRPPVLDDYGLVAALRWYGTALARRVGFAIIIAGEEPQPRLAAAVEHALFRIAQEALTNVSKHAQAGRVTLTVAAAQDTVRLVVADDGCGFEHADEPPPGERQHWGLLTMAERAEMVGGRCRITSHPGQGTQVIVEVSR
jgi:PAS domain S-box-containing protein